MISIKTVSETNGIYLLLWVVSLRPNTDKMEKQKESIYFVKSSGHKGLYIKSITKKDAIIKFLNSVSEVFHSDLTCDHVAFTGEILISK